MKKIIEAVKSKYDLKNLSFIEACRLAYDTAKLEGTVRSYEHIAERLDIGTETVHRYFTDPDYNCPAKRIPVMCWVLGNTIMLEWQLSQINAHMFVVEPKPGKGGLMEKVVALRKEIGHFLETDSDALADNTYSKEDKAKEAHELRELISTAEAALRQINAEEKTRR